MGFLESATQTGEVVSLLVIVSILLVLAAAAFKVKTYRSLQFQTLLFAVVLFAAEIPRVAETIGILGVTGLEDLGIELHSVSMLVLVLFLAYRIRGFMKGE